MSPKFAAIAGIMDIPETLALAPKSFGLTEYSNSDEMNRSAAYWLARAIREAIDTRGKCTFMLSVGRTPTDLYTILRKGYANSVDWSRVTLIQMDEYAGISCEHAQSFASYIRAHIADPLCIGEFICFNDAKGNLQWDLALYDTMIADHGGIDITLFGVGENGHLGFNEPGSEPTSLARIVNLDIGTVQSNTNGLNDDNFCIPEQGITVGLSTLLSSRRSLLLASGSRKKQAIESLVSGPVTPQWPVTFLRTQLGVQVMFTEDCAPQRIA